MRSVFVSGTDTGVGKTVLTAAICLATGATPMKPVQTGSTGADDLGFVLGVTGLEVDEDVACPYRFAEPLAPAVAARRAGQTVDPRRIAACFEQLSASGPVVVEGAGGLLVEVAQGFTMADLAAFLGLPVVIACRSGLGTLNHSALTVEAARLRGLDVLGLVITGWPAELDLAQRTNPAELAEIAPLAGVVPQIQGLDVESRAAGDLSEVAVGSLARELGGTFDPVRFLSAL